MYPQMIFGMGSGRCGTASLTVLLNKQPRVCATHEGQFLPWEHDLVAFYQGLLKEIMMAKKPIVAPVAFYWINYLAEIFRDVRDPKVICLKRRREEVVKSFAGMYQGQNFWSDPEGDKFTGIDPKISPLGEMFPKYNLPKEEAIGIYWDTYYAIAEMWVQRFPERMIIVDSCLMFSDEKYQKAALKFIGIKRPVVDLDIKRNSTAERAEPLVVENLGVSEKAIDEAFKNRYVFGQAAYAKGLPVEVSVQLSDEDWERLIAMPGYDKIPKTGEENGISDNGKSSGR